MAVAAALVPGLLDKLSPDDAIEFIKAAEEAAQEAKSLSWKAIHNASLTHKEQYAGVAPLAFLLYRLWQSTLEPMIEFNVDTQIGLAQVLNRFGAGIPTAGMEALKSNLQRSRQPFQVVKTKQLSTAWEVG